MLGDEFIQGREFLLDPAQPDRGRRRAEDARRPLVLQDLLGDAVEVPHLAAGLGVPCGVLGPSRRRHEHEGSHRLHRLCVRGESLQEPGRIRLILARPRYRAGRLQQVVGQRRSAPDDVRPEVRIRARLRCDGRSDPFCVLDRHGVGVAGEPVEVHPTLQANGCLHVLPLRSERQQRPAQDRLRTRGEGSVLDVHVSLDSGSGR